MMLSILQNSLFFFFSCILLDSSAAALGGTSSLRNESDEEESQSFSSVSSTSTAIDKIQKWQIPFQEDGEDERSLKQMFASPAYPYHTQSETGGTAYNSTHDNNAEESKPYRVIGGSPVRKYHYDPY